MFRENVFVCEDFLSSIKKTSYRKQVGILEHSGKSLLLLGFWRYQKFEVINAFSKYTRISDYRFLIKISIINCMEFFEIQFFLFGKIYNFKNLQRKLQIFTYSAIIGNMHLFHLYNEPSSMPVG